MEALVRIEASLLHLTSSLDEAKSDAREMRSELHETRREVRQEIAQMRTDVVGKIDAISTNLGGRIGEVEKRLGDEKFGLGSLSEKIAGKPSKGFIVTTVVSVGTLLAAVITYSEQIRAFLKS